MLADLDNGILKNRISWSCWCWCCLHDDLALLCCRFHLGGALSLLFSREHTPKDRQDEEQDHDTACCDAGPDAHREFDHLDWSDTLQLVNRIVSYSEVLLEVRAQLW